MGTRVLLVDDEKNILEAYRRNLHGRFEVVTAESGAEALKLIKEDDQFPVIVTDYKMPGMNGVELLDASKSISPDTVQIMLTGQAEMGAVIELINKGAIFRFLTKPCSPDDLIKNINDGIRQYELVTAERELMGKTLGGSIRVLTDLLSLAKPLAFHRAQRIRGIVKTILTGVTTENQWQVEIAAMLSQIGCVTIPDEILKKAFGGRMLTDYEMNMYENHPLVAADMILNIPRMEKVAEIIRYQEKNYDGSGIPSDEIKGDGIPKGSRLLKIALDYDRLVNSGKEPEIAIREMKMKAGICDPVLLESASALIIKGNKKAKSFSVKDLPIEQLDEDMYFAEDVISASGVILGTKNQKINRALIITLKNYEINKQIKDMVKVLKISD